MFWSPKMTVLFITIPHKWKYASPDITKLDKYLLLSCNNYWNMVQNLIFVLKLFGRKCCTISTLYEKSCKLLCKILWIVLSDKFIDWIWCLAKRRCDRFLAPLVQCFYFFHCPYKLLKLYQYFGIHDTSLRLNYVKKYYF